MTARTELRQATLISQQPSVPGTGTLTAITVTAPITGGGAGPVVPIGATQYDATHKGYVPSPGVNNHTLILFDDGWFAPPSVEFPITVAEGGTGIDGSNILDFSTLGSLSLTNPTANDSAVAAVSLSATDTNAHTSNVSWGIELPGDGASAGDAVLRTGAGVERVRVKGTDGSLTVGTPSVLNSFGLSVSGANGDLYNVSSDGPNFTSIGANSFPVVASYPIAIFLTGTADNASQVGGVFGTLTNNDKVIGIAAGASLGNGPGTLFMNSSDGRALFDNIGNGYVHPTHAFEILSWTDAALFASSLAGSSAIFQTSATDGSDTAPTAVFAGNTAQTAPLTEWRGTDGTTVVATVSIGGNVDAASLSCAGGVPYILPATNGAGVLTNDGAGNLSWV